MGVDQLETRCWPPHSKVPTVWERTLVYGIPQWKQKTVKISKQIKKTASKGRGAGARRRGGRESSTTLRVNTTSRINTTQLGKVPTSTNRREKRRKSNINTQNSVYSKFFLSVTLNLCFVYPNFFRKRYMYNYVCVKLVNPTIVLADYSPRLARPTSSL